MLILVRHGQTDANRDGLLQGRVDNPLNELGVAQAIVVARALKTSGAERIVASPLVRAQQTAAHIAAELDLDVETDEQLIELNYGDWESRPLREISAEQWAHWRTDPHFAPGGGESLDAVAARSVAFASTVLDGSSHGGSRFPTIAVSHVSPMKAIVAWALGAGTPATWRMHLDTAAVCRIGTRSGVPYLASFNEALGAR